jgi:hypothetical protein
MALNVVNGAAGQVIQNAGSWYAYDSSSVFIPYGGHSIRRLEGGPVPCNL